MRLSHNELEDIKRCYLPGMKVELQEMYGEPQMPSSLTGTVTMVDSIGQIHVNWDNGSSLALQPERDIFTVLPSNYMEFGR